MDLGDLYRPESTLTYRKLAVLVNNLPPESATSTAIRVEAQQAAAELAAQHPELDTEPAPVRDAEGERWSRVEHLLAAIKDGQEALRWDTQLYGSHQKPKWQPTPTPRPGVKPPEEKPVLSVDESNLLWALIHPDADLTDPDR